METVIWAALCAGAGHSKTHVACGSGYLRVHRVEDGSWRQNHVFVGLKLNQLYEGTGGRGSLRKRIQSYLIFANIAKTFDCVSTLLEPLSRDRHMY